MITILSALISLLFFRVCSRASLELEVVALRHQVAVLRRQRSRRLRLFCADRLLWVYRIWPRALHAMVLVKPATVVQWHRRGFRLYWRRRSRSRQIGRPKTSAEIRQLIRQMSMANPIWGAPRIHGELLMLGIGSQPSHRREVHAVATQGPLPDLAQLPAQSHAQYGRGRHVRRRHRDIPASLHSDCSWPRPQKDHPLRGHPNPTQVWLARQITEAFPWDTAPRYLLRDRDASYGQAFRDRVEAMAIKEVVTAAQSPWQNPYVERVIGSIRRECLNHVIVFDERHLRGVLSSYFHYYHQTRTHLSLDKHCPDTRPLHRPAAGKIIACP